MSDLLLVTTAYEFAARKHVAQRRKGIAAEPYLNHLVEVATLLAKASDGRDGQLVAAGVLHDTLEDTDTTPDELEAAFGMAIAQLVAEVTDDKALPKSQRKPLQVEGAPNENSERQRRPVGISRPSVGAGWTGGSDPLVAAWAGHGACSFFCLARRYRMCSRWWALRSNFAQRAFFAGEGVRAAIAASA